jgi:integrase
VFGTCTDRPNSLPNLRSRVLWPAMVAAGVALPVLDAAGKPLKDKDGKPVMRPKYSLHKLRHYAISSWLAAGIDLKTCQTWAGHSDLSTTINVYGHLLPRRDDHQMIAAAQRGVFG